MCKLWLQFFIRVLNTFSAFSQIISCRRQPIEGTIDHARGNVASSIGLMDQDSVTLRRGVVKKNMKTLTF